MNQTKFYRDSRVFEKLEHPERYCGLKKQITTRSSYETRFIFGFLETNSNIIEWSSEDIIIPYYSEWDHKMHRYFPDFYFKMKDGREFIVEIKPFAFLKKPKVPKRKTKSYFEMCEQYVKNKSKFSAAMKFCEELRKRGRKIEFKIVTDRQLYG